MKNYLDLSGLKMFFSSLKNWDNTERIPGLDDLSDTNIQDLYCEVYDTTEGVSKKTAVADLLGKVEDIYSYGVSFDTSVSSPTCTRVGNTSMHQSLPIQSGMVGCLLDDDGNVTEYLDASDWTGATRDGSAGQVMVEIPMHYRKFEENGTVRTVRISEYPLPGYHQVPKMYVSAYEATVDRTNLTLCSVVNDDAQYRGGNNNSSYDGTYRSFLGLPATNITRINFRTYARNRSTAGLNGCGWNEYLYAAHKAIYWLFVVEYATLNSQLAYNAELDTNGYHQGGLGAGVTNLGTAKWNISLGNFWPFVPCGYTDEIGNGTGYISFTMPFEYDSTIATSTTSGNTTTYSGTIYYVGEYDSETAYSEGDYVSNGDTLYLCNADAEAGTELTNTDYFSEVTRTVCNVPRYRGIENPFGHIWKWTDGVNVQIFPDDADEPVSKVYTCDDPSLFSDTSYDNYTYVGDEARENGYGKTHLYGSSGELIPDAVGGGSSTYLCDYHYTNIPTSETLRGVRFGGNANSGSYAGLAFALSDYAPSSTYANVGSRLCFLPE